VVELLFNIKETKLTATLRPPTNDAERQLTKGRASSSGAIKAVDTTAAEAVKTAVSMLQEVRERGELGDAYHVKS